MGGARTDDGADVGARRGVHVARDVGRRDVRDGRVGQREADARAAVVDAVDPHRLERRVGSGGRRERGGEGEGGEREHGGRTM